MHLRNDMKTWIEILAKQFEDGRHSRAFDL